MTLLYDASSVDRPSMAATNLAAPLPSTSSGAGAFTHLPKVTRSSSTVGTPRTIWGSGGDGTVGGGRARGVNSRAVRESVENDLGTTTGAGAAARAAATSLISAAVITPRFSGSART